MFQRSLISFVSTDNLLPANYLKVKYVSCLNGLISISSLGICCVMNV